MRGEEFFAPLRAGDHVFISLPVQRADEKRNHEDFPNGGPRQNCPTRPDLVLKSPVPVVSWF